MTDQEGFLMGVGTVALFFRICRRYRVNHPEDRLLLLRELTRRRKARYLRNVNAVTNGKRVLRIEFKPKKEKEQ